MNQDNTCTIDWTRAGVALDERGFAVLQRVLSDRECDKLIACYPQNARFRSRIDMNRFGFGCGEYKYFAYPLPAVVQQLRERLYPPLAAVANRWSEQLGLEHRYPAELEQMLERCHRHAQCRPTPLMLRYGPEDYNCLHQDLYGEQVFPIQVVILLSEPAAFEGGEFVLTEQRPRRQSRVEVLSLRRGVAVAFAVNERPQAGARGYYRVKQRHGVSRLRSGERLSLGVMFHDAA